MMDVVQSPKYREKLNKDKRNQLARKKWNDHMMARRWCLGRVKKVASDKS
jgi:hypothetical protein